MSCPFCLCQHPPREHLWGDCPKFLPIRQVFPNVVQKTTAWPIWLRSHAEDLRRYRCERSDIEARIASGPDRDEASFNTDGSAAPPQFTLRSAAWAVVEDSGPPSFRRVGEDQLSGGIHSARRAEVTALSWMLPLVHVGRRFTRMRRWV